MLSQYLQTIQGVCKVNHVFAKKGGAYEKQRRRRRRERERKTRRRTQQKTECECQGENAMRRRRKWFYIPCRRWVLVCHQNGGCGFHLTNAKFAHGQWQPAASRKNTNTIDRRIVDRLPQHTNNCKRHTAQAVGSVYIRRVVIVRVFACKREGILLFCLYVLGSLCQPCLTKREGVRRHGIQSFYNDRKK